MIIMENKRTEETKSRIVVFRFFQALFWGIFALGISLMSGDIGAAVNLPISSFSMTTTIFGLIGAMLSGHFAKVSENW